MEPLPGPAGAARACAEAASRALRELPPPQRGFVARVLLGKVTFADDPTVETARLRGEGHDRYTLVVSPAFLATYVADDHDALFVLLHELLHRAHGDLHLSLAGELPPATANLVCDMFVNSRACSLAFPKGAGVLAHYYPADRFPTNLLLAPAQLAGLSQAAAGLDHPVATIRALAADASERARLDRALTSAFAASDCAAPDFAARIYARVWFHGWSILGVAEDIVNLFERGFPFLERTLSAIPGLVDHACGPDPKLRAKLETETPTAFGTGGREHASRVARPDARDLARFGRTFFAAVQTALTRDDRHPIRRLGLDDARGVVPGTSRRDLVLLAGGFSPVFYAGTAPQLVDDPERAHVYLDVSASTRDVQSLVYGLVLHAAAWIGNPVHLFSTTVVDTTLARLRAGHARTTGGTDLACVIDHALSRRYPRILVATDGIAQLSPRTLAAARKARLQIVAVLLGHPTSDHVLRSLGARIVRPASLRPSHPRAADAPSSLRPPSEAW